MAKQCAICGKGVVVGKIIIRRGMAKKKGGVGQKTTRTTPRRFLPNLQKVKLIVNGRTRRTYVCAKCIKAGKV
ncbi:MAG: 50S ribosomal protein L28 [Candidatus Omnitrophota bacterium]|nr:50S ribosomal protein L28 [Candidatus Omnitrophota bacterium]